MAAILFQLSYGEEAYLPFLKPILSGKCTLYLNNNSPSTILEVAMRAKEKGTTQVATTSEKLLHLLLGTGGTLNDYAGSIIEKYGIEFLILRPLEHLVTVPFGRFLYERSFRKFLNKQDWLQIPSFEWELFTPSQSDVLLHHLSRATFISCDIETGDEDLRIITCIGFTAVFIDTASNTFTVRTIVVPFTDVFSITFVDTVCRLSVPKVFQNGKYDNAYLLRYGITVTNWAFDTAHMFHAWYSELPKDLGFIIGFLLRKWQYWKNESSTTNLRDYYAYNAKDAFTTAMALLALLQEMPQWALDNYNMEFPLVYPCLLTELTGLKVDKDRMEAEEKRFTTSLSTQLQNIQTMVGCLYYNPSSPPQTLRLFSILGSSDIKNTKPHSRDKVASRHPLNKRLMTAIKKYREDRKIATSYLRDFNPKKKKYKLWNGIMYYSINPHMTDTGRLNGQESAFWCGTNIHNQPRNRKDVQVKSIYVSYNGFLFGEGDYEQAETRDTAYLSGDTALIAAVEDVTKDFHGTNASKFFGVPYEKIINSFYDAERKEWVHEKLDVVLRDDIGKRVNHGANYNMGAQVLLDTMGMENVAKARAALGLPKGWTLKQVAQYLLNLFEKTYPVVKGAWYDKVKSDVAGSRFLIGPTGWHRYCFGNPKLNKRDLNAYVAHPPQSLNAMVLNKAYLKVFKEVWLPNQRDFKLGPQIHDSILFQYRIGREDLAWQVKKCMEMKVPVKDSFGITRDLFVPVAMKGGAAVWSDIKKLKG